MADLSYHLTMTDTNAVIALISEAIDDSMGTDWTSFDAAHHVMQWLTDAGLGIIVLPKRDPAEPEPGSNEWLAKSPLFHPGDLA